MLVYPLGTDGPRHIRWANAAAADLYGYSADKLREMTVADILVPGSVSIPDALGQLRAERRAEFESEHRTRDGDTVPMRTHARLATLGGELCVVAVCRDDRERRAFHRGLARENLRLERSAATSERGLEAFAEDLRILHRIVTADHPTPEARYDAFLRAGCEMFDLPLGILAETPVDPATRERLYRLEAVVTPDPAITAGMTIPLRDSFCDAVYESGGTVTYADAAASVPEHPACRDRGLRAYIGTPVIVDGEWFGTVNFVSPQPRRGGFTPAERELVEVMAGSLGREIALAKAASAHDAEIAWRRAVAEAVGDAVLHLRPDGSVAFANEHAAAVLDADGRPRTDRVDRDGRPLAPEAFPEAVALREGAEAHLGLVGIGEDGARAWYSVTATPVDTTGDGAPNGAVAVFRDLTAVHAAAQRAVQARDLLGSVLVATPEGVLAYRAIRGADGEIEDFECLLANPQAEVLVGRPRDELVGRRLLELFPGTRETGTFDAYRRVVESGEMYRTTLYYPHDGFDEHFGVLAVPLPAADGVTVSFVPVSRPAEAAPSPEASGAAAP